MRSQHLPIIQMASTFLSTDRNMFGGRLECGPGFIPGFRRSFRMPCMICSGYSPVLSMFFSSLATPSSISGDTFFINSAFRLSSPTLILFFKLYAAFSNFMPVKGVFNSQGGIVVSAFLNIF